MFVKAQDAGEYTSLIEGINIVSLVHGERTLMAKFSLAAGSNLPLHSHPHEQTGYLLSGRMRFTIDGSVFEAEPGDSWTIAGDVVHGAEVVEDALVIEVFSPVREDYLPENLRKKG